ncbi:non-ribosomal peptide synthetase [Streptomyces sp. UNOC14_S4]|uniref:non-ribosomal peptide synthetase n=1 Tax=Streptomyces sp. UNOC14_S4 TaxID=2872340 RepID=UPI001E3E5C31|nr:non-ribosomal peptide synthetase [Streptomyces sp. UNOC14_S4]MCC3767180.1 amino acid adenylation domain-containing protein [Streptomyces sp. UNOC14_S4]
MTTGENTGSDNSAALRDELLRQRLAGGGRSRRNRIPRADRTRPLPLSFGQRRLWLLDRIDPDTTEYLVPLALRMRGRLNADAWQRAWTEVQSRHEVLRTRYETVGGEPVQVIDPAGPGDYALLDFTDVPEEERAARAHEFAVGETQRPFRLDRDWPARLRLLRLAEDDHVLVVACHHIALDGWSIDVLLRELRGIYQANVEGRPSPLQPLTTQYADYAAWERAHLANRESFGNALGYWRGKLTGAALLELPTDRPRPATRDWSGAMVPFALEGPLAERLREIAREQDTTLYAVLLAAFKVLLHRYTGERDISVGSPVAGRGRPEVANLVGFFVNTLVLRTMWAGDPAFEELLGSVRDTVTEALVHQEVPFEHLVNEVQPERDPSRSPLFQVMLGLRSTGSFEATLPGLTMSEFPINVKSSRFDLTLLMSERPDGSLDGEFLFPTVLFDAATVERFSRHYGRLLASVAADPHARLSELVVLDGDEIAHLTPTAGAVRGDTDDHGVRLCLHEAFEAQVRATPDAIAVVARGTELTYAQLNARANRIAHHLRAEGARPETLVGVCLERGEHLVPALLGILKSGAAYLPLDPSTPAERLRFVLEDTAAPIVLTQSEHEETVAGIHSGTTVVLDRTDLGHLPDADPEAVATPGNLIYVIYTSGSTGRPKGVCLTHANVARLLATADEHYAFSDTDVWPLFHSYAFDVSVWELWGSLLYGGRLIVVPFDIARSPEDFLDLLVEHQVTVLNQTPTAFRSLVAAAAEGDPRLDRLALRAVVFAGEKLEMAELRPWADRMGLDRPALLNMYGITETTVHSTFHRVVRDDLDPQAGNPIGRPLEDLRIYLLDPDGNLAPTGVPGEIYVGGPGVARGYFGRPDLTAQRFVPDPFGPPGSRLYRSGDVARRLADGSLEFSGRIDHQVKIRGYRVELGEIEAALAEDAGVQEAVVIVREDAPGDRRLVAYVIAAEGHDVQPDELRGRLGRVLPSYMVPAAFVALGSIPLTVNGKLDKRALPAPGSTALATGDRFVAPRTTDEERVAAVWREVIGLERIGVEDAFFDLGGDSVLAVALTGAMRTAGFDVAVRDIFEYRTVAGLCEFLSGQPALAQQDDPVAPFALISARDRDLLPTGVIDAYPMSGVQLGMVVEMLADNGERNYHNVTTMKITDDAGFSAEAFHRAAQIVAERHENLRTSFELTRYSQPLQLVHASAEVPSAVHDVRHLDEADQDSAIRQWMAEERERMFDLAKPSLLRLTAHLTDDRTWWFSITECHPVLEGWSYHQLLMEVLHLFRTLREGGVIEPAEQPSVRYADFIAAEQKSLASEEDKAYWRETVSGTPALRLPTDWHGDLSAPRETYRTGVPFHDLLDEVKAFAAQSKVSLKSVLHAVHLKVMSMITEEESFFSGLVCDTRPESEGADRVYGMYLNTVPFVFERSARTWTELVQRVFAKEIEIWPHRRHPIPAIQRAAGGERLIDVYFNYIDFHVVDTELVDYIKTIDISPNEFSLRVTTQAKHFSITVNTHIISKTHADRLTRMYRLVLETMLADPDGDTATVPLLPEDRLLIDSLNATDAERSASTAHELVRAQARLHPDTVAVVGADAELTFHELDERSDRIAGYLRGLGVGPETVVGVLLARTPDLLAVLLGIWKAGGAYLPLDPSLPDDRIAFTADDANVLTVITDGGNANRVESRVLVDEALAGPALSPEPGDPDRLAYVIYTSGSTGHPKGVTITHGALSNLLAAMDGLVGAEVWLASTSLSFDISGLELFLPLTTGGRVVLATGAQARDGAELVGLMRAHGVTHVQATPSGWKMLLEAGFDGPDVVALVGGEALPVALAGELRARTRRLVNVYGPTETTIWSLAWEVPQKTDRVAIGRPIANTRIHVLDTTGHRVPVGVVGELAIGGAGVARGYLDRPALSAERFVTDPHGGDGDRLYLTGDLVRVRPNGNVEFVGRRDGQVKVRGHRVELGEIEAQLLRHPGVRDAAVVVWGEDARILVGYVVGEAEGLEQYLAAVLPAYMVPAVYVTLDALPLNTAGKVDRKALPAPSRSPERSYVVPHTADEQRIAAIWAQSLGLEQVGAEDAFFELGGDSIKAISLVGTLRAAGYDLSVRDIFTHHTVAGLAAHLTGHARVAGPETYVEPFALTPEADRSALPSGLVDAYPLSQLQLGMVVEMLARDGEQLYHNVEAFRIRDGVPFSPEALREAARIIAERHEIVRTSLDLTSYSVPLQLVRDSAEIPLAVHDVRGRGESEVAGVVGEFMALERARLVDIAAAPLLRLAVHIGDDDSWWLTVAECHAVLDGWSHHGLLSELIALYAEVRDGVEARPYARPVVRYADFVAAELASIGSREDRRYWEKSVMGVPKLTLPEGWGEQGGTGTAFRVEVPFRDLEEELRSLASRSRTSFKSVLHAAHLKVMSAITEEDAFFTGLACDARPEALGADRVYGMYLNTVPFVFERSARTWTELVQQVFAKEIEIWPHRRHPLPSIQRALGSNQLIDVHFTYLDFHAFDSDLVDTAEAMGEGGTEFGLAVTTAGGSITLATNTRALSRANADRLAQMYRAVLTAMAADPDGDATVACLPDGERERQLVEWNGRSAARPAGSVLDAIESQVRATPGAPAVVAGSDRLSFRELDERANRLAHHLRELGVGSESTVGVLVDRGPELLVSFLAVWKVGAAYVPLDPALPADRIDYMLADCRAPVVITTGALAPAHQGRTVLLDRDREAIDAHPATCPERFSAPETVAYVIYTSGSTGRPKGVQVTHRGLENYLSWAVEEYASRGTGGAPLLSSTAFDMVVPVLYAPLMTGQPVTVFPSDFPLEDLGLLLLESGPFSFVKAAPALLSLLTQQLGPRQAAEIAGVTVVGGEAFPTALAARWQRLARGGPRAELVNEYGPTEATVGNAVYFADGTESGEQLPIGLPIPNTTMYVLDKHLSPVPIGVTGELFIGGDGLARGYLGRPELTAQRFVPDPYGPPGARLYRTGDLARRLPDGNVDFLGRADDQVKIRGFRVEPGEVEAAFTSHPGIGQALVVARVNAGDKDLIGYVVPASGAAPDAGELREHLAARLPAYMLPAATVVLDRIPLTPNGKVDRAALPEPTWGSQEERLTPRTAEEERIIGVWRQVLGLERVGVEDSFFDLGGDSLKAVGLVGALRAAGFDVSVRDVFAHRTVAALASSLADGSGAAHPRELTAPFALVPENDRQSLPTGLADAYPVSQIQLGMLVEMLSGDGEHSYHNVISFRIRDGRPFAEEALREAAAIVCARHEVLRTSFELGAYSVPLQLVHESAEIAVSVRDLRGLSEPEQEGILREFAETERSTLFDLATAPLLRLAVHSGAEGAWWLTVTHCHAILEGWSYHSLLNELISVYERIRDGREAPQDERPELRYADFIAAEVASLDSDEDRRFWRHAVEGAARLSLPTGWGDDSEPPAAFRVKVPYHDMEEGLRGLAARSRTSLKSVLHAVHLKVMSMITGEESFASGLVCDARPEALGADRVYGMYLNTVPFVFERSARTWTELVQEVFAKEVEIWPHRRHPLPSIQQALGTNRLVDVWFNYLDFRELESEMVDLEEILGEGTNESRLSVTTASGHFTLATNTRALSRANADRLAQMYRAVLTAMAADPDGDATVACLPDGERERQLVEWNGRSAARPAGSVLDAIESQVRATPGAPAVVAGSDRLSFRELDERANRLAHHLRELGVGSESTVGVLVDRGPELLVSFLAVWKVGAAYVPLDPALPADRIDYMLADSRARVVLTQPHHAAITERFAGTTLTTAGEGRPTTPPTRDTADPRSLAYVVYTSGSTGHPKGVQVPHQGLANYLWWAVEEYAASGTGGAPLFSSVAFDMVVPSLYAPLMQGRPVTLLPNDFAMEDLGQLLSEAAPFSFVKMTPGHLDLLTHQLDPERAAGLAPLLVVGADAFPVHLVDRWYELVGEDAGTALLNEYGPTEISVANSTCTAERHSAADAVPIGLPIPNTTMYVLDPHMEPVPIGVTGEVYVGGDGLARGYAGLPGRTASSFVPDPYGPPGARLYRTGDLARRLPDGNVDFLGRADDQIKVRGYRVEPGEVRSALVSHPRVRDAIVGVHRGGLIAHCVPEGEALPSSEELAAHCGRQVPPYMVPEVFIATDRLPLTRNGKVDRGELPSPDAAVTDTERKRTEPCTSTEEVLAEVWRAALELPDVGVLDDFHALGGHSLTMVRVVALARKRGIELSPRDILECRTISALAGRVDASRPEPAAESLVWLTDGQGDRAPLFVLHAEGGSAHWFVPLGQKLDGERRLGAFEARETGTVEEMAARYVTELLAAQPHGPHTLLAWSAGATWAWEVARLLGERGLPTPTLVLVDPLADLEATDSYAPGRAENMLDVVDQGTLSELSEDLETWRVLSRAAAEYRYAPTVAAVHLVVTDECASGTHSVSRGHEYEKYLARWAELAGSGLRAVRVRGSHEGVLAAPGIDQIADLIREVMGS